MAKKVEVEITGKDELSGVLGGIKGSLAGLGNIAMTVATGGIALLGAGMAGLGVFIKQSVDSAMEAQEVMAQLDAVLVSTGGAAGVTSEQAIELADSFQQVTKFSDETILAGENMLLTFTNIGKDVFPAATETMLNMSQALGQDVKNSAIQLGKALNNPIQGVSALRKVGVQFTDDQEKMIKSLVESGDLMGAQTLILKELQTEFGGSAEAAGKTFAGQLEILKNQFDEVKESVGMAVIPLLQRFVSGVIVPAIPYIQKFADVIINVAEVFGVFFDSMAHGADWTALFTVFEDGSSYLTGFAQAFGLSEEAANTFAAKVSGVFQAVVSAIEPFITFLDIMKMWWDVNGPGIMASVSSMGASIMAAFGQIASEVGPLINNTLAKLSAWFVENGPLIQQYVATIAQVWNELLVPAILIAWNTISPILSGLVDVILGLVTFIMQVGTGDWAAAWETIKQVVVVAGQAIWQGIINFLEGIAGLFDTSLKEIGETWSNIFRMLPDVIRIVANDVWGNVVEMGTRIVEGIKSGISAGWEALTSWLKEKMSNLVSSAASALGIHSPSTEFAYIGEQIMAGLGKGIGDGVKIPVTAMTDSLGQLTNATMPGGTGVSTQPLMPAGGAAGGITIVLEIQSPVTVMDERTTQATLTKYIEAGVRDLQTRGVL
jgi:hypothetical protein